MIATTDVAEIAAAPEQPAATRVEPTGAPPPVVVRGSRKVDIPLLTEPLVETPQSILVVTDEILSLTGFSDTRDTLRLDPGVSPHADEDSAQGTNVYIRGFSARNDLYRDGQLDLGRYYRDPFDLEAVQVLTGPSSVLFGRGSTGGAVNDIAKRPLLTAQQALTVQVGTEHLARAAVDVNAPLGATSAVRVDAVLHRSGTAGRDEVYVSRAGISPTIGFGLGTRTEFIAGWLHQDERDRPDYGVPWLDIGKPGATSRPVGQALENYYGFKDDFSRVRADIVTLRLKQALAPNWSFTDQFRYGDYDRSFRATEPGVTGIIPAGASLLGVPVVRTVRGVASSESLLDDQASVSGKVVALGVTHKLVFGGEIARQTSDPTTFKYAGVPGTVLLAPGETALFSGVVTTKSAVSFKADTAGAYVGDTLEFGQAFELEGVARVDRFAAHYRARIPAPLALDHSDTEASWRAAFVYKIAPGARAYIMTGTSFDPSAEGLSLSATTADLAPLRTRTTEVGAKWDVSRALLLSVSLFRTVERNYREASPTDPTVTTIVGTARSEGAQLTAQGRITPRWLVFGGYTYLNAQIVSSPNADVGRPVQNAPRHNLALFTTYDVLDRVTVGGSVNASSGRVPTSFRDANGFWQVAPGYTVVSGLVRYRVSDAIQIQLNADNLFDKRYFSGVDDNHINVGAGRSLRLTLELRR